jgi:hypothetical protein
MFVIFFLILIIFSIIILVYSIIFYHRHNFLLGHLILHQCQPPLSFCFVLIFFFVHCSSYLESIPHQWTDQKVVTLHLEASLVYPFHFSFPFLAHYIPFIIILWSLIWA